MARAVLLLLASYAPSYAQTRKLSADYAQRPVGRVGRVASSPDGARAIFDVFPTPGADSALLYSVPADLSAPATLVSRPMIAAGGVPEPQTSRTTRTVSPDSSRIVYVADARVDGLLELFSAPLDGSTPAVRLNAELAANGSVWTEPGFRISADSARVVYVARHALDAVAQLYSAPLDGSAAPVRVTPLLPVGRAVTSFAIAPDGVSVVYVADALVDNRHELFVAPIDGSAAPLQLSAAPLAGSDVLGIAIAPDGTRVAYRHDVALDDVTELFTVPLDGSLAPQRLHAPLGGTSDVSLLTIAPDSTRVGFVVTATGTSELRSAPLDASSASVRLDDAGSRSTGTPAFTADSSRVLWRSIGGSLYSAPPDGSATPLALATLDVDSFVPAPTGRRVLYSLRTSPVQARLWSVPADGSAPSVDLTASRGPGFVGPPAFTPDGTWLVFTHGQVLQPSALLAVPVDGSAPPQELHPDVETLVGRLAASAQRAFFVPNEDYAPLLERPLDASASATTIFAPPLVASSGDVTELALSPDRKWALYRGDQEALGRFGLHAVRVDGSAPSQWLTAALPSAADVETDFAVDASSTHALFRVTHAGRQTLRSVPLQGGAIQTLNGPLVAGGNVSSFTTAGASVAFRADAHPDEVHRLFLVPVGGGATTLLTPTFVAGGDVLPGYRFDAAGARVLYLADQEVDEVFELYAVDASATPLELNAPLVAGGDVTAFVPAPSGSQVCYLADQTVDGRFELFLADGASPVVPVGASPTQPGRSVESDFRFTPDGQTIVFRADAVTDERIELWRAPVGGGSATRLNATLNATADVQSFELSPDGQHVVYVADQPTDQGFALYARPLASGTALRLSGTPSATFPVVEVRIGGNSQWVAYAQQGATQRIVSIAPIDGSAPAISLPLAPFPEVVGHGAFRFSPDGEVLVVEDRDRGALLVVRPRAPLAPEIVGGGDPAVDFEVTNRAIVLADDLAVPGSALWGRGAVELFALGLGRAKVDREP